MKKSKFSEEQIAYALREVEGGRPRLVADLTLDEYMLSEALRQKV